VWAETSVCSKELKNSLSNSQYENVIWPWDEPAPILFFAHIDIFVIVCSEAYENPLETIKRKKSMV